MINGDGIDEVYKIMNPEDVETVIRFEIFNRWGQSVFITTDKMQGWDGKLNGIEQPIETYVYYLEVQCYGGVDKKLKGDITLVR